MRRKVKLSRILILILIPILIVSGSVYVIYMLFTQEESVIEEKSYYDLNLFSLENGLMTYKDSLYKVSTGIDVSSHNGAVDWAAVKADGIEFAMLRIGYRGAQEGILHEDEYFNTNIQQAIQNQGGRIDDLSLEQRTKLALRFCKKIKEAGYQPMIYGNMTWLYQNYDFERISKYPVWLASYSISCPMEDKFDMWQYSNKGQVNGIEGNVDMNIYLQKK